MTREEKEALRLREEEEEKRKYEQERKECAENLLKLEPLETLGFDPWGEGCGVEFLAVPGGWIFFPYDDDKENCIFIQHPKEQ